MRGPRGRDLVEWASTAAILGILAVQLPASQVTPLAIGSAIGSLVFAPATIVKAHRARRPWPRAVWEVTRSHVVVVLAAIALTMLSLRFGPTETEPLSPLASLFLAGGMALGAAFVIAGLLKVGPFAPERVDKGI